MVRNCTAAEAELHIRQKYGVHCLEGGFCRVLEPNTYYCECLPRWAGPLCNEADYFPSQDMGGAVMSVYLPLPGILLLLLIVAAVAIAYCGLRRRRGVSELRVAAAESPPGSC